MESNMNIDELKKVLGEYQYELISSNKNLDLYNCGKKWVGYSPVEIYVSNNISVEEVEVLKEISGTIIISELGTSVGATPNSVVFYPKKYAYSATVLMSILDSLGVSMLEFDGSNGWLYGSYGDVELIFKIDLQNIVLHGASQVYDKPITKLFLKLSNIYNISIVDFNDTTKGAAIH